jgi:hypothetical protein
MNRAFSVALLLLVVFLGATVSHAGFKHQPFVAKPYVPLKTSGLPQGFEPQYARSFEDLVIKNDVRSASDLVGFCTSTNLDRLAYCEGYIELATRSWKYSTACESQTHGDPSFCAGATAAQKKIQEILQACGDCAPDERLVKLKTAIGTCLSDAQRDERYCSGYNWEVANKIAELSVQSKDVRGLGVRHGAEDLFLNLWTSKAELLEFRPCLQTEVGPQQLRNMFLGFIRDNPEQQRGSTAIMALEKALFYELCPGPARGLKPHMEQCTAWDYGDDGQLGTKNTCDKAVVIQFMAKNQRTVERQLNPGDAFRTGISRSQIGGDWWFTACPVGYVSSVPFLPKNLGVIRASQYSCARKRKQ